MKNFCKNQICYKWLRHESETQIHKRKKTISYEAYEVEYVYSPANKVLETQFESGKQTNKQTNKKTFLLSPENKTFKN
jgi:predicted transcriptional regulator